MEELTIGEVSRRTGLRTSALRYYEAEGILPAPRRVNGRRRYDSSIIPMVALLQFAKHAGFTLSEIRKLFHGFSVETPLGERWRSLARAKLEELDQLINRATRMKHAIELGRRCGCARVEECVLTAKGG
ncbi:MAG TPA: MerR family transcriptional regulator [Longimicrobiales bacterium]